MAYGIMERRIFKFGKNSVALIIPKKWSDKTGLMPGNLVSLEEDSYGNLIVSKSAYAKKEFEIDISKGTKPELLGRWIGLSYMYGMQKLRVYSSDGIAAEQVKAVADKVRDECSGFEITSQSNNDMIIEGFTDIKDVDIERVMSRIMALVSQEYVELGQNTVEAVHGIEKLVNRFYMLGIRYINITQAKDSTTYFAALNLLEDISDKLDEMSAKNLKGASGAISQLGEAFALCHKAFDGDMDSIDKVFAIKDKILKGLQHSSIGGEASALIASVAYSISNIAEFGLMKERNILQG